MDFVNEDAPRPDQEGGLDDATAYAKITDMIKRADFSGAQELVAPRLTYLEEHSKPIVFGSDMTRVHRGYLHRDSEVFYNSHLYIEGFHPDDPELYVIALQQLEEARRSHIGSSPNMVILQNLPRLMQAYFGNIAPPLGDERAVLDSHTFRPGEEQTIRKLKGSGNSVCISQATAAQEFLAFCGMDTSIVIGRLEGVDIEQSPYEEHAYNLIEVAGKILLLDAHNPVIGRNKDKGMSYVLSPGLYPITQDQKDKLLKGGSVEIDHEEHFIEKGVSTKMSTPRTYHGPRTA